MLRGSSLLPDTEALDPQQQFTLLDYLGQGAYGSVSKAIHNGQTYAVKILPATTPSEISAIKKEIQILKLCDNDHIVKYYGSFEKDHNLWIVLEFCHGGSVIDLINITQRKLNEHEIASILESVIQGLDYLHSNKKIHRDIKAANILLSIDGIAKLADFGVSTESMYTNARHRSQVGSPYWMSPEVLRNSEYTNKTDIWSLGVTAIELAEGVVPNSHIKPYVAIFQLKDKPIQGFQEPTKWSPEFNAFVRDCLNTNPALRPEAKALLNHEFILKYSKGQRLLAELVQSSMNDIDQFRRGTPENEVSSSDEEYFGFRNGSSVGAKTIVNNHTERSQASQGAAEREMLRELGEAEDYGNSSMVINENDGSMIINNAPEGPEKPSAFLNRYISGLKSTENEVESQKQAMKRKIADYDANCLAEIEQTYAKYRTIISELLQPGNEQLTGLDPNFITSEIGSKLHKTNNVKEFLLHFPKYEDKKKDPPALHKEFERSEFAKKKSEFSEMAHHSTQTNDPGYADVSQFREIYPRGVKSQEFNEKEFRTNEKHCFNSKSIISDMENVKYKDYPEERFKNYPDSKNDRNKRFIVTEPYEWNSHDSRPSPHPEPISLQQRLHLKELFCTDTAVFSALNRHIHQGLPNDPAALKHDRVAESTLYHDCEEDTTFKHQNSVTVLRGQQIRNNYSEQDYLILNEEHEAEDNEIVTNLFEAKASTGKSSKNEPRKKPKPNQKQRMASTEKRPPAAKSNAKKNK